MRIGACKSNLWLRVTIVINIVMESIYGGESSHRFYFVFCTVFNSKYISQATLLRIANLLSWLRWAIFFIRSWSRTISIIGCMFLMARSSFVSSVDNERINIKGILPSPFQCSHYTASPQGNKIKLRHFSNACIERRFNFVCHRVFYIDIRGFNKLLCPGCVLFVPVL